MHESEDSHPDLDRVLAVIRKSAQNQTERETLNQAWEAFYQITRPRVFGLCYRFSRGDRGVAEEMCQEAYLRMWRFPPSDGFTKGQDLFLYALHVAQFACKDYLRAVAHRSRAITGMDLTSESGLLPAPPHAQGPTAEELAAIAEWRELLEHAFSSLNERDATIVRLRLAGYSHEEIGAHLNISSQVSRTRLNRVWSQIRKTLPHPDGDW